MHHMVYATFIQLPSDNLVVANSAIPSKHCLLSAEATTHQVHSLNSGMFEPSDPLMTT